MNEDRLNEIEALAQTKNDMYPFVVELVAEVRRLRNGITELADEGSGALFHSDVPTVYAEDVRALLGEGNDLTDERKNND